MEWISTKDKLPDIGVDVLAVFIGWDDIEFIKVLEYDYTCEEWSDLEGNEYKTVTYWMPLPNPPKQ